MKEEDRKYEEWLNEIRSKQPVLNNPDQLAADIMQRVSGMRKPQKNLHLFGSWLSGIAAAILLCFLLTETMRMPVPSDCENPRFIWESATASPLPQNWKSMTLAEKGSFLSAHQKQLERQKKLIYKNLEKKYLKETPYENK